MGGGGANRLEGGEGADRLFGGKGNDQLYGDPGDDELYGNWGNDTLDGGKGDDRLEGGAGADQLKGGAGNDTISYAGSDAAVDIRLSTGHASGGHAEGDEFSDVGSIIGSAHNDRLDGDANDNELTGGAGDDRLEGGAGADTLTGGTGTDTISYAGSDAAVDIRLSAGHASGGHAKGDAFSAVENIIGSAHNDRLDGDANDNELTGGAGADRLYGGAGNDFLSGNYGDDRLKGGAGDDRLEGGAGADTLTGGTGTDTISYAGSDAAVDIRLSAGHASGGHAKGDAFSAVENIIGSAHNDRLDGDANDNKLSGMAGDDRLEGGTGHDSLSGGEGDDRLEGGEGDDNLWGDGGDDTLDGGEGNDFLSGNYGDDRLKGGAGADWLYGRDGADTLTGGAGTDIFTFHRGDSLGSGDVITDFRVAGADRDALDLRAFNIDLARDLESQGLTLSGLMDADGDGATDDRKITLPDGGTITLLNLGTAALVIDDFTFAVEEYGRWPTIVDPEPEGQPDPEPEGNGGALTGALTNVEAGADPEVLLPQQSILQQHLNLLKLITSGASGRLDAGDLSIGGGLDLPASDDGLHRSSYHLYYRADGGSYFLRFDDAVTADLPVGATAVQVDAALEGLDGITSAEVSGEPGNLTIALTADEPHVLQWGDLNLGGDGSLDYLIA